jgi:hypothetical protein
LVRSKLNTSGAARTLTVRINFNSFATQSNIDVGLLKRTISTYSEFTHTCRQKKREREREELWKRLGELESSRMNNKTGGALTDGSQQTQALGQDNNVSSSGGSIPNNNSLTNTSGSGGSGAAAGTNSSLNSTSNSTPAAGAVNFTSK